VNIWNTNRVSRVLVVEDEAHIRELIQLHLGLEGLEIEAVADGQEALVRANSQRFDLMILDIMLPGIDGLAVCRAVRREGLNQDVPILMLTARSDESDKVLGLESGADDYLTKPFGSSELLARVRVALRHAAAAKGMETPDASVEVGPIKVDHGRHEVTVAGAEVHLTPIEFRLLALMMQHAGKVLTHRQILRDVWGPGAVEHTHYLRVHMAALRKKIEKDPARPEWLLTEPGVGYRLRDQES
jgi:two-component system KDP operon response regulator KdpE